MRCLQGNMLQGVGTEPRSSSADGSGIKSHGVIRRDRDFNLIPIGISKPERISEIGIAIALGQGELNAGLIKACSQSREFSIGINFKRYMVEARTLDRAATIARTSSGIAKSA